MWKKKQKIHQLSGRRRAASSGDDFWIDLDLQVCTLSNLDIHAMLIQTHHLAMHSMVMMPGGCSDGGADRPDVATFVAAADQQSR